MKKYLDTESGHIFTEEELQVEYNSSKSDIEESSGAKSFQEWIMNCTSKNGFLEEI